MLDSIHQVFGHSPRLELQPEAAGRRFRMQRRLLRPVERRRLRAGQARMTLSREAEVVDVEVESGTTMQLGVPAQQGLSQ